jgi:RimJ/RimL family protein N-acetyltransferase
MKKKKKYSPIVFRQGPRLYLRPVEEADLPLLVRYMNDPQVTQFLSMSRPVSIDQERDWFKNLVSRENDVIVAVVTNRGLTIGTIGLHRINWIDGTAVTGSAIGDTNYWDKGFGTEAKMLLLEYGFNTLNLRKICSSVYDFNGRSMAALKKQGYVPEGILRQQHYRIGRLVDEHQFALFKETFLRVYATYKKKYGL